jgi:hypothetical protein
MALTRLGPNQSVNLASNVTGTLATGNGGTGSTAATLPASLINNTSIGNVTALPSGVGGKILGHHYEGFSIDESTTSSTLADVPSNKGRASYTTVGADSNFIVSYGCNYKQTGNHASYLYFFQLLYNRLTMQNIDEGTLITNNDSTTQVELLDPGTLAAGTALYFQPQFSSQATGTLKYIQLNIYEVAG